MMKIFSLCCFLLTFHLLNVSGFISNEPNDCGMTFMYFMPKYMDVGFKYGNYGYSLWLYAEGLRAISFEKFHSVDGIPVIFVPGNGGSGKQARSIGSLLQNKTTLRNSNFHFDVFTLDFNEELSGFDSKALYRQADYLEKAIDHVWNMYQKSPSGIIFLGHSMGGIVIRMVLGKEKFDLSKVAFILTLSTPHQRPPILMDSEMLEIWRSVDKSWNSTKMINSHVRLVSISGGMKDDLIAESLTSSDLPHIRHLSSTGLDRVWLEADHKAIVWCNQLVRQTSRIFFAFGEDPEGFRNNVDSVIENHFEGPQQSLAPLKAGNENVNSLETCLENGKCFKNGFVSFTKEKDFTVVVVRFVSSFEVISVLEDESSCKIRTRYLTINCFCAVIGGDECVGTKFLVNTNTSKLWVVREKDVTLEQLNMPFVFQTKLRNFKVTNGIVRIPLLFDDFSKSAVFHVKIQRKCSTDVGGIHRVFQVAGNLRRFDKTHGNGSFIRIYNPNHVPSWLYFLDSGTCEYEVEIWLDLVYTIKQAVLEWISSLFFIVLLELIGIELATMCFSPKMIFSIGIGLIATFGAVFPDPPIIILIFSLLLAILIKFLSNLLEMLKSRFSKKFEVTSKDSVLLVVNGIVVSLASVLIPWILAPFAFLFFSNKNDNSSTKVFKLLFVIFMSIPGSIFAVDLIKHGSAYEFPSAMFVNSSLFLWLGCLSFGIYKKFTYLLVTMAFYRLFAGDLDYVYYVQSVEAQCYLTSIVYLLFLVVKN